MATPLEDLISRGSGGPAPSSRVSSRVSNRAAIYSAPKVPGRCAAQMEPTIDTGTKLCVSNLDHGVSADGIMERVNGRTANQLRQLACSRNVLNRAHGSARWSQGNTVVVAVVYGPRAGTRKGEKASIEVIWKPKSGQIGKLEREYEMILTRTLRSICCIHPNTTTSVILQVVGDDGSLLPCAINATCAALVDAGIPLKYLAAAICCGLSTTGSVILDPTKVEEKKMQAFVHLVFANRPLSVLPNGQSQSHDEGPIEHGIITSVICGMISELDYYISCIDRGRAACAKISEFLRRSLLSQVSDDGDKRYINL